MKISTKALIWIAVAMFLVFAAVQGNQKQSLCDEHPGGQGIKTLDEKYDWVMQCNNGRPSR